MPQLLNDVELHLVNDIDTAMAMKRWLGERRPKQVLGFDTETHGLDIFASHARLRMVQIGDSKTGWAIPWERWGGVAIEIMDSWKGDWTAHNLPFDAKVMKKLANYQIPWSRFHDTLIMQNILNPGKPAALKVLTDKHIDPRASIGQKRLDAAFKNHGWTWDTVPIEFEDYWFYSALDPVLAANLYDVFAPQVFEFPKAYDLEMAVRRICTEMEYTGMRVDLEYAKQKHDEISTMVEEHKQWAEDNWGINVGSGPQLVNFLKSIGAEFTFFTDKGAESSAMDQLEEFMRTGNQQVKDAAKFVVDIRKYSKINSSYFSNFLEMHTDSVLYPSIKTSQAKTGRMSITQPALQTLPSNDSLVRKSFIRRNPGDVMVSCDYSQMELRLMAHFSEDEGLINAFKKADDEGGDFFVEMGKLVFDDPEFQKSDPRRAHIKTTMYAMAYGGSAETTALNSGIALDLISNAFDKIKETFPGINSFMEKTINEGRKLHDKTGVGYVELSSGRRLPADSKDKMYTLTNYILQGTGAELTKKALVRLDLAGLTPYMQVVVHDEILFSIPEPEVEEWLPVIKESMSFTDGEFLVDIPADPEVYGESWGNGYKDA